MLPAMCRTPHRPPESYGDCLRACIATVMDVANPDQVPHFHHDGPSGPVAMQRVRDWLHPQGYSFTGFAMPGDVAVSDVLAWMGEQNPETTWLLMGSTGADGGDHVNVCQGGRVVHDPAWIPTSIKTVGSSGFWEIWVVSRL